MIKLSKRLKSIADYVSDDSDIIDVGCDHGLLDIYLMQTKKNITLLATDVNKNALDNAVKNIKKYKLNDKIDILLTDGLNNVDTSNKDTIIISGMGSHTIVGILYNNLNKLKGIHTIIIQSNNNIDFLRKKITKIGYYIEKEKLVKEKGIIYTIIKFKKGFKFYNKKQLYLGPVLLEEKSDLFYEKNEAELSKLNIIYKMIPKRDIFYRLRVLMKIRLFKKINNDK